MSTNIPKRKRFDAEFKRQVALEALKGEKTIQAIAAEYNIHPTQVNEWKKQALETLGESFGNKRSKNELKRLEKENDRLKKLVGQRDLELDWLTKKSKQLGL